MDILMLVTLISFVVCLCSVGYMAATRTGWFEPRK
jgi:NADH:ubiquinone oxidoreductase subunit 5 (subunit L)/multisubunit Na+/H+ antiporter MnhA subunit